MMDEQTIWNALQTSADDLARELERLPEAAATWRAAEGAWSQHECLTHLQICERHIFLPRLRAIAHQDNPRLPVVDEGALMQAEWNPQHPRAALLDDFRAARREELALLEQHGWSRQGVHETRGPISSAWVAAYALAHTWEHLSQMMRVRLYYETRQPGH
jgi:hypothetical protein